MAGPFVYKLYDRSGMDEDAGTVLAEASGSTPAALPMAAKMRAPADARAPPTTTLVVRAAMLLGSLAAVLAGLLGLLFWLGATYPGIISPGLLALTFGLRHAVDADHIAAIDNVTRRLVSPHPKSHPLPRSVMR